MNHRKIKGRGRLWEVERLIAKRENATVSWIPLFLIDRKMIVKVCRSDTSVNICDKNSVQMAKLLKNNADIELLYWYRIVLIFIC